MDSQRLERAREVCRGYVDRGQLPFTQVIVLRDGVVQLQDSYGFADVKTRAPIRHDSIVRVYSMTKPVACVAALMCYERGLFEMSEPIELYLPEFKDMQVFEDGKLVKPKRRPNIKQLFLHTAGIGSTPHGGHRAWPTDGPDPDVPPASLEEHVRRLASAPLAFHPGARWNYSGCHTVLGRLVEVWTGMPFGVFLEQHIFGPLGMVDTGFRLPEAKRLRLARNYELLQTKNRAFQQVAAPGHYGDAKSGELTDVTDSTSWFFDDKPSWHKDCGSAGLASTLMDYAKFCQCLLSNMRGTPYGGVLLLGRKTLELMVRDHCTPKQFPVWGLPGLSFGLGVAVTKDATKVAGIASEGEFWWGGAASTLFWIDPSESVVCVFMTQLMPSDYYPVRSELRTAVNQAIVGPPAARL